MASPSEEVSFLIPLLYWAAAAALGFLAYNGLRTGRALGDSAGIDLETRPVAFMLTIVFQVTSAVLLGAIALMLVFT